MAELNLVAEPGSHAITYTRVFDAPRDMVFRAYTEKKTIPQWWGPRKYTTAVDKMTVKPGGTWRFLNRDADGNESAFNGVYHLVDRPAQIVSTFEFEGLPERHVSLDTVNFETQADGTTKMSGVSVFQSVADRDAMLESGMEEGFSETLDRLEELLNALQAK